MKKLLMAVLVLGLVPMAFGQGKGKVEFGLNIGYNNATVSDADYTADNGSGFNLGASADYYFSDAWSMKIKLIYDQKGWDNGYIILDDDTEWLTDFNLNYVTVPVMASWHFAPKRNWYLSFGPYVGFLVDAKETHFDSDVKDGFNTTDFGLAVGIGVKIPVSNKLKIFFEYEGQGGFSNIFKDDYADVTNSRSSFNAGINFMMN